MTRPQSRFVCQACAAEFPRWEGQCRSCGEWNSLVETVLRARTGRNPTAPRAPGGRASPVPLGELESIDVDRLLVGIGEFDRVLGGGLVPGSVVLLGGSPGIGKSTLLLQVAAGLATAVGPVLYASGEESAAQVALRGRRLGLAGGEIGRTIRILAETDVEAIVEIARTERPAVLVVDSIQTASVEGLASPAGSVGQVREATMRLMELAKGEGIAVILVGHVTKDGTLAGPKALEHLVDAVLSLEGERHAGLRLLRATKNRFGSTEEVGVLEMGDGGLRELSDPGRAFLDARTSAPGSVASATLEGSRPLVIDVQALVAPGGYGTPRRTANGFDANRLAVLVAVLARRAGIALGTHDVYVNLAGGLEIDEPALDLAVALALASSLRDRPVGPATVAIGEVGLLGELRPVGGLERRLREAARLGFRRAIVPAGRSDVPPIIDGLAVDAVATLRDAIGAALDGPAVLGRARDHEREEGSRIP